MPCPFIYAVIFLLYSDLQFHLCTCICSFVHSSSFTHTQLWKWTLGSHLITLNFLTSFMSWFLSLNEVFLVILVKVVPLCFFIFVNSVFSSVNVFLPMQGDLFNADDLCDFDGTKKTLCRNNTKMCNFRHSKLYPVIYENYHCISMYFTVVITSEILRDPYL